VVGGVDSAGVVPPPDPDAAGAVVSVGTVVSVGAGVVVGEGAAVDTGGDVTVGGDAPESLLGRRTQISTAVTTTMASDASTATVTSRRSRGGRYSPRRFGGLIVSTPFR
jgi:hypothetical protein